MPQDLIIGAKTGGSSNLLRINDTSRRFSFRDVDGSWKEAASVDFAIFEKPDEVSRFLVLELSANANYSPAATLNSQMDQTNFIYYDGAAWSAFPAGGISPTALGTLVAFNFAAVAKNLGDQIFFRFWWSDGQTTTEKKASIFPAMSLTNSGASSAAEVETATDSVAGVARAATQTEVDDGTAGFIFVTPATLNAKKFAASKITGLAAVATSGDYNDLSNKYELPAASASARGGVKIGSNINLTNNDVISVASASASSAGVVQLASATEVMAGTVDNKAVTPAGLKVELDKKASSADLKAVALSGSYNDLTDKPEIPEVVAASTTQAGIVRLATTEEAAGELDTIAVTPAGLNSALSGYYTSTEIDNKLSVVIRYKGVKATEAELPSSENEIGDFWLVSEDSSEYVWNGTAWEKFGATISLDGYLTTEAAAQTYVAKTQLATSTSAGIVQIGQNISINSGVISVSAASTSTAGVVQLASTAEVTAGTNSSKAVTPAGLKVELDKKVNLAALAAVATSGDYNDLSNKYELPAATSTTIGGVKPGGNLTVTADGTLNFTGFGAQSSDGSSLSSEIKVLKAGSGTQFSYNSGVLTIGLDSSVTGGLTAVSHDSTLTGQGTSADPLKVNAATSVAAEADASDDKIPTELAVRKAVDAQKVTKLVLQRGVSDKALYPKIAFSSSADFSSASEFDFSSNDFARSSARVFNGTGWVSFPAGGLDASYNDREVAIDVVTLLGDSMPQLPFYFKYCWVESDGTASDYKSSIFPAAPSFAPEVTGVVKSVNGSTPDENGAITIETVDESRLLPAGAQAGNTIEWQEGVDQGNGNDVKLLLQNALTDSATGNASPVAVTTQGVTLTGDNNLLFDGNDSHVTAVLATDEIFAADKEWTIDFWMKPTANSSEWNYILTENRGDWGSHSIGLTWNKSKSVLEQDTGGYVASVIKAPNWPNASTPCASGQWHFVAVEKQKTATGWSLNYYLNGAIWLQAAFTGEFVPFTSDNPFWFGGKTTDSGRWFKGEANKLRVTAGARYGGKAFAVPDRLTDYAAPAGQPVWAEGIDRSRLLPENPANGDIPCFDATATVGGGNDANTKLLIQPETSNNQILDQAAGNAAPVDITNSGNVVIEDNALVFTGTNSLLIPANALGMTLGGNNEFTIDIEFQLDSVKSDYATLYGSDGGSSSSRGALYFTSGGAACFTNSLGPDTTGWTLGTKHRITVERWNDNGTWKTSVYRNGSFLASSTSGMNTLSDYVFPIGSNNEGTGRNFVGKIWAFRISNKAIHGGQSFTPDALPWTTPQTVGEWGKLNKSELVQSVNGVAPDESGNVTVDVADESRLLPKADSVPTSQSGHALVYDYQSGIDADTLCLLHLDDSTWADATGKNTIAQHGSVAKVSNSGYFNKALDLSGNLSSGSLSWLTVPWLAEYEAATWTMEFFAKPTKSVVNFMFFSFGDSQGSYLSLGSQSLTNLWFGNGSGTYTGNFSFSLNTWYWFVIQYDGSAVKVYVDGQLVVEGNFTPNYVGQDLQFGNLNLVNNQDNTFIGYLDEFRWSKGLRYPTGVMEIPTQPFGSSQAQFKVAEKKFVTADSSQLLPANPANGDMAVYRKVPEDAAPQNLTSATSDSNWEVTWSGAYSGRVGWQAFDSDQSTVWCTYSAAVGDWLCWEYKGAGGKVLLRRYSIAKGSGNGDCPTGWKIQGSNDGSIWVDLDEQTGQSFPNNDAKEYTIPNNSTPYKFHRFYLLSWNTSNMIGTFKAWSWINSTDECNRWVTVDIADLQGTSENEITLVRPVSDQSLFPVIEASADVGFTSTQTINTRTVADDRVKVKVFNGSAFADFPDSGLGTPYDEQSVVIDVSSFIAVLGDSFYVRYKWESSDGTASDYKAAKFPLSVAQTPVVSTGGGTGNVSYQTLEIPAQDSWTTDSSDTTRKYLSVASGRCSCIVYDANGIEVGVEVQYVSSTNETRLLIPADLTTGTITADWTCRYAQISEN